MRREEVTLHSRRRSFAILTTATAAVIGPLQGYAATKIYLGAGVSNWNQASNWAPAGEPAAGDDAFVFSTDIFDATINYNTGLANPLINSVHLDASSLGNLTLAHAGQRLRASTQYVGEVGQAVYAHSGGTNEAGTLYLGFDITALGSYAMSNGATLLIASALYVGYGGTGVFNQTGGTVNASGGGEVVIAYFPGSSGTYNLAGGTFNASQVRVSDDALANGQFNQSGGTASINTDLAIATFSEASTGTYMMSGGQLNIGQNIIVGDRGSGDFVHTGGTVRVNSSGTSGVILGAVGGPGTNAGAFGNYTLSGTGVLSVTGRVTIGLEGDGSFTQTGGTHRINGDLVIASVTGTNIAVADYDMQGGTLDVNGNIQVNAGGTFSRSGGTLTFGTFTLDGGTVNGTLTNNGIFTYNQGTFAGRLVNQAGSGVVFNQDFTAGNGMDNATSFSIGSNRTLILNGAGWINTGTVQLSGGVISGDGPGVNNGNLTGHGIVNGSAGFSNNANWTITGGNQRLANSGANANNGTLTLASGSAEVSLVLDGAGILLSNNGTINVQSGNGIGGTGSLLNEPTGVINAGPSTTISANFTNQGSLVIGIGGAGDLAITAAFTNSGTINLADASSLLSGGLISNTGLIQGRGQITNPIVNSGTIAQTLAGVLELAGTVTNQAGANINVGAGATLLAELFSNAGTISVNGGTLTASSFLNTGQVNVSGTFDASGVTNSGSINFTGAGTFDAIGAINNTGTLAVAAAANAVFFDPVTHNAGGAISIAPGATATFLNNATGGGAITNAGSLTLSAGQTYGLGQISGGGNLTVLEGATLTTPRITQGAVALTSSGTNKAVLSITPAGTPASSTSKVTSLTLTGGGTPTASLDLANTNLVIDYTLTSPIDTVRQQLQSGYNNGLWTGDGIRSSTAIADDAMIGYGEASTLLGLSGTATANWNGQTVDATSLLMRYTEPGDVNIDGQVGFLDLLTVAANFGNAAARWGIGDVNYDGQVGFVDLVTVAAHFGGTLPASIPGAGDDFNAALASIAVPEPAAALSALGVTALLLPRRRKR